MHSADCARRVKRKEQKEREDGGGNVELLKYFFYDALHR